MRLLYWIPAFEYIPDDIFVLEILCPFRIPYSSQDAAARRRTFSQVMDMDRKDRQFHSMGIIT